VSRIPIIRVDNPVCRFIRALVVLNRRPHEPKIHKELSATSRNALSHPLCGLFPNVGLLLEVDVMEGVVLKNWRGADNVDWKDVKLMLARGTKSKHP
jgi:hypothetical protein